MHELVLVILATDDLPRLRQFYIDLTGWQPEVDEDNYVELNSGSMRLGLYDRPSFLDNLTRDARLAPNKPGDLRPAELYFTVPDPEMVMQAALAAGAQDLAPVTTKDWGDRVGYIADPDGNVCAIAAPAQSN